MRGMLGLSMFNAGKYGNAVAELEDVVKRDPGQVQTGSALMAIYMQSGQAAKAVKVGDTLLKHQPGQPGLHNLLGTARARTADLVGARASFKQAIKLDANFIAPQVQIARLDNNARVFDAALARLNGVLAKDRKGGCRQQPVAAPTYRCRSASMRSCNSRTMAMP